MKTKTFIIWLCVIAAVFSILFFYGCSAKGSVTEQSYEKLAAQMQRPFEAKAKIKAGEMEICADFNKTAPGYAVMTITQPQSISGMTLKYNGEDITVGFKGMEIELSEKSPITQGLIKLLVNAVDKSAQASGVKISAENESLTLSGKGESGTFNIVLDAKTHSVVSISLPDCELECQFDDRIFK